jgi:hypothetical protein
VPWLLSPPAYGEQPHTRHPLPAKL